jgi:uncharacterized membrane protein YjgN (DUF898 family)
MAAVLPDPGPGNESRLVYDGRTGELFLLCFLVLLLNIVTLGFYRFWGRTRIRKYLWSHVSLNGDRFTYDGTGGELFVRFLVALLIIVPLFSMVALASAFSGNKALLVTTQIAQALLIVYLSVFAYYTGHRYRLSRTTWRGIRGGLEGSANLYALMWFGFLPLQAITLGLAAPWQFIALRRYETRNAGFGDANFCFEGTGRGVLGAYLLPWGMMAGLVVLAVAAARIMPLVHGHRGLAIALLVVGFVAYWFALVAAGLRYWGRAMNYAVQCMSFHGMTFASTFRGRRLLTLWLGNIAIVIFTLGFASALAAQRIARFYCRNLQLANVEALDTLSQAPGRRQRRGGEGLLQVLDTGGFA